MTDCPEDAKRSTRARRASSAPLPAGSSATRSVLQMLVGDVRIVVRRAGATDAAEFEEHLREAAAMLPSHRATLVIIAETDESSGPTNFDARQRAQLKDAGLFDRPHAIVAQTASPLVGTALRWLNAPVRMFKPEEIDRAFDHVLLPPALRARAHEAIASMKIRVLAR